MIAVVYLVRGGLCVRYSRLVVDGWVVFSLSERPRDRYQSALSRRGKFGFFKKSGTTEELQTFRTQRPILHGKMNISQPVSSAIGSVDFAFLSSAEIKALSVKSIQNPLTFDTLLNPVPGGLYDPALGAWGDNLYAEVLRSSFSC
jgi:hypothetical protein